MEGRIHIYSLNCPITNEPKYIGKSHNVDYRYKQGHLKDRDKSKKTSWIINLKNQGLKPTVTIIDSVLTEEWKFWERHYISLYRSWGFSLKNMTDGGDGVDKGTIPWNKGLKYKQTYPNMTKSKETREKISKACLGRKKNKTLLKEKLNNNI